jgi:hypothetical protein
VTKRQQKTEKATKTTTINLDKNVHAEVKRIAESQRRDFSSQIQFIVDEWLEQRKRVEEASKGGKH